MMSAQAVMGFTEQPLSITFRLRGLMTPAGGQPQGFAFSGECGQISLANKYHERKFEKRSHHAGCSAFA